MPKGISPRSLSLALACTLFWYVGCAAAQSQRMDLNPGNGGTAEDPPQPTRVNPPMEGQEDRQEDNRPGVAVWSFSNGGSFGPDPWDYTALEVGLQQMLITELAQNSEMRLINRDRLQEIIDELELGQTGYVSPETTAEVGRLVGARYIVMGSFIDAAGTMRIDARIDNVETGEILVETAAKVQDDREKLFAMVVQLGVKVAESVDLPALPDRIVEERMAADVPGEATVLYSQAMLQDKYGNRDEAVRILRRVVSDFPEFDDARQTLEQYVGDPPRR